MVRILMMLAIGCWLRLYISFEYDPDRVSYGKELKYNAGHVLLADIPIEANKDVWAGKAPAGEIGG